MNHQLLNFTRNGFYAVAFWGMLIALVACGPTATPTTGVVIRAPLPTPTLEPTFTPKPSPTAASQPSQTTTLTKPIFTATHQVSLLGRILDQTSGQPVPGATVNLDTFTVTTDADGRYTLTGLSPGQYVLAVTREGYDPALSSILTLNPDRIATLDLTLYATDTTPYPQDPMLTNPLDPNGAPTPADAERLARLQGLAGQVVNVEETKLRGRFLVNYKLGDEVRSAVAELSHDAWQLTDDTGQVWWIIKVCGNLARPISQEIEIATPKPVSLPPLAEVVVDGLVVRVCASEACVEVGMVDRGMQLEVFGCLADGSWCQVALPGGESGWCTGRSLRQLAVAETVPVVEAIVPTVTPGAVASGEGKIAFLSNRDHLNDQSTPYELYLMNPDGSRQTRITHANLFNSTFFLTWMTGYSHLFYETGGPTWGIINLQDASSVPWDPPIPVRVNNEIQIYGVDLSPDGQNIAYLSGGFAKIYVVSADGNNQKLLFQASQNEPAWIPSWSPNGRKIAFSGRNKVQLINVDGSDLTTIADTWGRMISWSPDGTWIVFECGKPRETTYWSQDICVVNIDGTGLADLTNTKDVWEWHPTWSPDGKQIAFDAGVMSSVEFQQIYVINADGTGLTQLTFEGNNCCPAWSR